jgi:hypothetical protein
MFEACGAAYGFGDMDGMNPILYFAREYSDGYDISEATGIGFYLSDDDRSADCYGLPTGDWSGVMLDNFYGFTIEEGETVYTEVIIIDELLAATPSEPGECIDVEFSWEDMPTGHFIEKKSVPDDDNNDNNEMSDSFDVETLWAEADPDDVESEDLTEEYDCHWHVQTSGYNNYIWCGLDEPCAYDDDWNDILLFAPDGEPEMDWAGLSNVFLELDEWSESEVGFDYCLIEINPHIGDPGYQWYIYDPPLLPYGFASEGFEGAFPPAGWTLIDHAGSGFNWMQVAYPWSWLADPPGTGSFFAIADNDWWGPDLCQASMVSPPIDMSVYPFYQLDFAAVILTTGEDMKINVWSGGPPGVGTFEETIFFNNDEMPPGYYGTGTWSRTIDPANYATMNPVYLDFEYDNLAIDWLYWFGVDDLEFWAADVPAPGGMHGWTHKTFDFTTDKFVNPITSDTFQNEIGGFTDEMGLRIRFISDGGTHYRGVMLDNLHLYDGGDILELDEADDMENFICDTVVAGDYWYYDALYGGWICQDQIASVIPNDVDNALVWETSVPQAVGATLHFTHEYDLESGDYCYLEFSTDGGNLWIAPIRFTGAASGDVSIDMGAFTGDNVLIRWRVSTNETGMSTIYKVKDMRITADIDTEPPMTIGTLSGTVIHGWYSTPVTFAATATDDYSGVAATYYKIDGGSTLTYGAPISISVNGEHFIEYWSVDNVGNVEAHHITPTFKIDSGNSPTVSISAPGDGLYLFGNQLLSLSGRTIIIGGFTVEASASDSDSGVYRVQFALDGTIFGEDTSSPFSAYCGEKHTGAGTITVTAEDFTGNTASASKDITYFKFL